MVKAFDLRDIEKGCAYSLHRISKFIEPCLLLLLTRRTSHGYELLERLEELGFHRESMDVGAVYRTLRKLEKDGFVKSSWRDTKGKKRKRTYTVTPQGVHLLALWTERIKERKRALIKFMRIYNQG